MPRWFALCLAVLGLALGCAPTARAEGVIPAVHSGNPLAWIGEVRANYRNNNFYATDLTTHPTLEGALRRSMAPVDMAANVHSAIAQQFQPLNLAANVLFPIVSQIQRQVAATGSLDLAAIAKTLDPKVLAGSIGGSLAGGFLGGVAGASLQSALCGLGPVGAAAGFVLNPLINFFMTSIGTQVGQHIGEGQTLRNSFGEAFREIQPIRDTGQALGTGLGYVIGQVLIPIPLVGGIVGSMIGGLVGATASEWLLKIPAVANLESAMRRGLGHFADWIEGKSKPATASATTPFATAPPAPSMVAGADLVSASDPTPTTHRASGGDLPPTDRSVPNFDDVPVGAH